MRQSGEGVRGKERSGFPASASNKQQPTHFYEAALRDRCSWAA